MKHSDQFIRIGEMLKSIEPEIDLESIDGRAQVARAMLGSVRASDDMTAICECGWRGFLVDCHERPFNNGAQAWQHLGGRNGWHHHCPECDRVVWKYYFEIN